MINNRLLRLYYLWFKKQSLIYFIKNMRKTPAFSKYLVELELTNFDWYEVLTLQQCASNWLEILILKLSGYFFTSDSYYLTIIVFEKSDKLFVKRIIDCLRISQTFFVMEDILGPGSWAYISPDINEYYRNLEETRIEEFWENEEEEGYIGEFRS